MDIEYVTEKLQVEAAVLSGSKFVDVGMGNCQFESVNMAGTTIKDANLSDISISNCDISGLTINGVSIEDLISQHKASVGKE